MLILSLLFSQFSYLVLKTGGTKKKILSSHLGTHASLGKTDMYFAVIAAVTTGTKKNHILHDKEGKNQFQRRTRIN